MRKLFIAALIALLPLIALSQPVIRIPRYNMPAINSAETQLVVQMPFGKAEITQIMGDTTLLKDAGDIVVDVVCTEYPSYLSLTELNNSRLENLLKTFPYIRKTQLTAVNIYRQLDGSEKQVADTMFHGLVVRFRPRQTAETMRRDITKLDEMLQPAPNTTTNNSQPKTISAQRSDKDTLVKPSAPVNGYKEYRNLHVRQPASMWLQMTITPDASTASSNKKISFGGINTFVLKSNLKIDSPISVTPKQALEQKIITPAQYNAFKSCNKIIIVVTKPPPMETPTGSSAEKDILDDKSSTGTDSTGKTHFTPLHPLLDSTLFKVLARNKWRNAVVVGDVTGSMYPYTGQLLLWLKMNGTDSLGTEYVFFNDGDGLPDDKKVLGETGGIYSAECNTFEQVLTLVKTTMGKGGGGDNPENDIEALMQAEQTFPHNDFEVLVADNWAPIRDKALMNKLTKPVRIVVFGADYGRVNVDFLNLARKTKGSVHLIDEDITNLASYHDGQVLQISVSKYKLVKGEFVDMNMVPPKSF